MHELLQWELYQQDQLNPTNTNDVTTTTTTNGAPVNETELNGDTHLNNTNGQTQLPPQSPPPQAIFSSKCVLQKRQTKVYR